MSRSLAPKTNRLPFSTKALYGLGTVAFGVKDQGFSALLMIFYNQVVGLPADWVGAAIMIAMIADALVDPLLGQWSDETRTRWGRRHPFMYASVIPVAVSYFALWLPPDGSHEIQFVYLVVSAIFVRLSISLYEIPSTALLAEFTNDYNERTRLVAYRFFFGVAGGIGMGIVAFATFFKPTAAYPFGQLNPAGYVTYAWVAAFLMLVSIFFSSLGTHRRIASLSLPAPTSRTTVSVLLRHMMSVLLHPTYLSVILFSLLASMASGLSNTLNIYFATYVWALNADQIAALTSAALIGVALALFVALPASARFGKKRAATALYAIAIVSGTAPLALRLLGFFPINGDPALIPTLMGFIAIFGGCTIGGSILAVSMVADVTEQVRLSTGRHSEGLLFSVVTMVNKAISGMGVFISGLLLSAVAFPDKAIPGQVPQAVLDHLAIVYLVLTTSLFILAIICLSFYPITQAHHDEALRRLGEQSA